MAATAKPIGPAPVTSTRAPSGIPDIATACAPTAEGLQQRACGEVDAAGSRSAWLARITTRSA